MENQRQLTLNRQLYELDALYKSDTNLLNYINEAQRFFNGEQYPNENYNNMIRVVMNICEMSSKLKASKITGTQIYLTFTADNLETDCTALRQFDEYNCGKLKMKDHYYQSAINGLVNGTDIVYMRWDEDDTTYKGIYKGGLAIEHIDIRNFAVANPYIQDIQNQQWVMFWEDYPVAVLKDMCEGTDKEIKEKQDLICREAGLQDAEQYKKPEYINYALCTCYTRFFRIDGEVYFMCETENVSLFSAPHPLNKKLSKAIAKKIVKEHKKKLENIDANNENEDQHLEYDIDLENTDIASITKEVMGDKEYSKIKEKFTLYPFAVFRPSLINRSFYGKSDIKSLIPIQKAINFGLSMNLQCAQNNAYNKILVKPEALQGQEITNEPSQVLIDYSSFTNQWGIKPLESQPMPNGLLDFTNNLIAMTRTVYGFNDVMDGSVNNQNLSGYAVQQMIEQANTSLDQIQRMLYSFAEDLAQIRVQFYKHYVDKAKYTTDLTDAEYEGEEQARQQIQAGLKAGMKMSEFPDAKAEDFATPVHKTQIREISNDEIYGINWDINVDAMQGLNDSKLIEQQTWDNLLLNNGISQLPPENLNLYLQCAPNISPRTKASLKNVVDTLRKSENTQLKNQIQETVAKTQQIIAYTKQLEARLGYESKYIQSLTTEFTGKVNAQNQIIDGLMKDLDTQKGESEGKVKSDNARGIKGDKVGKA